MLRTRCLLVGLTLTLSGCLLPQPDTPVIPPFTGSQTVAAPAKAPTKDAAPAQAPVPATAPAAGSAADASGQGMISNNAGGLVSNNAGGLVTNPAGATTIAPTAPNVSSKPATLNGHVSGMAVKTVVALSALSSVYREPVGAEVDADGAFTLALPPGPWGLQFVLKDGSSVFVEKNLTVDAGETRSITVTLQASPPKATIAEEASLVTASPSPAPSKAP